MNETAVYRTRSSKVLVAGAGIMAVFGLVYLAVAGGAAELVASGPWVLLAAALIWALFGNPRVEVSDGGITVVNVARTVHVPWPVYQGVETQWSLKILTREGAVDSWAIPAPSGYGMRFAGTAGRLPQEIEADARRTPTPTSKVDAVSVAYAVARRYRTLVQAGYLTDAPSQGIHLARTWNTVPLAVAGGTLLAAALTALL